MYFRRQCCSGIWYLVSALKFLGILLVGWYATNTYSPGYIQSWYATNTYKTIGKPKKPKKPKDLTDYRPLGGTLVSSRLCSDLWVFWVFWVFQCFCQCSETSAASPTPHSYRLILGSSYPQIDRPQCCSRLNRRCPPAPLLALWGLLVAALVPLLGEAMRLEWMC